MIHDGGGTTFAYHCMDSINRFIYGISNPYFHSPEAFEGSLADLGEVYTAWIRTAVTKRDFSIRKSSDGRVQIYLGGWSLGGMLSLEIARRLVDDEDIKVVGILMVDTIYPGGLKRTATTEFPSNVSEPGLTKNEILSRRCMVQARRMVGRWKIPVWDGDDADTRQKSVLLRAKERLPTAASSPGFDELDTYRADKRLGWGRYEKDMFTEVFPVDGHHFDLFSCDRVEETTKAVKRALERLDTLDMDLVSKGSIDGCNGSIMAFQSLPEYSLME